MRWLLVVLLAACSTEPAPERRPLDAGVAGDARLADGPAFSMTGAYVPVVHTPPPARPAIESRPVSVAAQPVPGSKPATHGGAITAVAITDDGRSAVSADGFGAVRLWPTLDGKLEPVAVTASHPVQLAIAHDSDHFVIAALDHTGSLEVLSVRTTGAEIWRSPVDETRPYTTVVATQDGFIAITDDQRIALLSLTGASRGHLVPAPGERVVGLAHRNAQTLALIATGDAVHGRWITSNGWGSETPRLRIAAGPAVLSPDGSRLAARSATQLGIAVVSTETGRVLETIGARDGEDPSAVGFIDAYTLAVSNSFTLGFVVTGTGSGTVSDWVFGDDRDRPTITATGNSVTIGIHGASLMVATPAGVKFLGFKLVAPTEIGLLDHGAIMSDGAMMVRVDDRFIERERYALPPDMWNAIPLDAHHALVLARNGNQYDVVALDLDDPDASRPVARHVAGTPLSYEPATHLFAAETATSVSVGHYDPRTGTFDEPIEIPIAAQGARFVLPSRGFPIVIAEARASTNEVAITEVRSLDFAKHAFKAGAVRVVPGVENQWSVQLYPPGPVRVARGPLVAEIDFWRITLRDGDSVRWVVPARGIRRLFWSARGELVGAGEGLVHLDLATGALTGQHCGWWFGLWDETSRFATGSATLCDVRE